MKLPKNCLVDASPPKRPIMVILRNAAFEGREILTEDEAKKILKYYNFPVVRTAAANNVEEAVTFAQDMGFPVVLKILVTTNHSQNRCRRSNSKY